ncbi:MAG TPA: HAMP domain-containing sensor histidine kinase [Dehalococcoidia bacterium]|nr:HAMP domain-containing sensor histidine kinase [Dehalococcoidia bacterium]
MSLRTQLAVLAGLLVAVAVVAVSLAAYYAARDRLRAQVDNTLLARAAQVGDAPGLPRPAGDGDHGRAPPPDPFGVADTFFQVIDASGTITGAPATQQIVIPVASQDLAVARGASARVLHDATTAKGVHLRVLTSPGQPGHAVQIARTLAEVDASLSGLRRILFGVGAIGVLLAGGAGLLLAQRTVRPVAKLTAAAEHVASTQDLTASIEVRRKDEIGRLALSFNAMLYALNESRTQQRQLVADASHELRTPLTSLRTNIEVLLGSGGLPEAERQALLDDVAFEMDELTKLIAELVDLASEQRPDALSFEDVRLDELAAQIVERAARRSGLRIELAAEPALVEGQYGLLERAAGNLIDNACKWSPQDAPIEVRVAGGRFEVRDHGPGIAPKDLPHVFDRFYRADTARSKPGSGLGLAIVKQIIDVHGGKVWVESAPDGTGTVAGFELPSIPIDAAPSAPPLQPA